jgi:hypothetical protein
MADILKRLTDDLARTFQRDDGGTPTHLRQLPEDTVAGVVSVVFSEMPHMPHTLALELKAFSETRTVHDARRVANALRHAYGQPGLAQEIEDAIAE